MRCAFGRSLQSECARNLIPSLIVHSIIVHFEGGSTLAIDPDHVHLVIVKVCKLTITAVDHQQEVDRNQEVSRIEVHYRAADKKEYQTTVVVGTGHDDERADNLVVRRVAHPVPPAFGSPRAPIKIPAGEIVAGPGGTFAVVGHSPRDASAMSQEMELGWHRRDCTWIYPT